MPSLLSESALASLAQLGALDPARAVALLDSTGVVSTDFDPSLRAIMDAVTVMLRDGRVPEVYGVVERSRASAALVTKILVSAPSGNWLPLKQQLEQLRSNGQRRQVVAAMERALSVARGTGDLGACLEEARKALDSAGTTQRIRHPHADVMEFVDHVREVYDGKREPVLSTGLEALDAAIGGLHPTLTVVGALPGVGKSALLARIAMNLAQRKVMTGIISLEDEGQWLVRRFTSAESRIPLFILVSRPLREYQLQDFGRGADAADSLMDFVLMADRQGQTTDEVVSSARAMVSQGAKVIFVDHLGMVRLERSDRHDLDVNEVVTRLRSLAVTCRVPVVLFAHLRRRDGLNGAPEDKPRLNDFAFSSGVERTARVALGLTRPNETELRVHVLKQTQGVADVAVDLLFDGPAAMVGNRAAAKTRDSIDSLYGDSNEP